MTAARFLCETSCPLCQWEAAAVHHGYWQTGITTTSVLTHEKAWYIQDGTRNTSNKTMGESYTSNPHKDTRATFKQAH